MLALGGLAVSYAAIARLVTGRSWVIATIAALLGGLGAFAGAMLNVLGGISLAAAASAHTTQTAGAQFLVTSFGSWPAQAAAYIYFASDIRRAGRDGVRAVAQPRRCRAGWPSCSPSAWKSPTRSAFGPKVVLFMLPFAAAMILLAVRIWRAAARPAPMTDPGTSPPRRPARPGTSNGI